MPCDSPGRGTRRPTGPRFSLCQSCVVSERNTRSPRVSQRNPPPARERLRRGTSTARTTRSRGAARGACRGSSCRSGRCRRRTWGLSSIQRRRDDHSSESNVSTGGSVRRSNSWSGCGLDAGGGGAGACGTGAGADRCRRGRSRRRRCRRRRRRRQRPVPAPALPGRDARRFGAAAFLDRPSRAGSDASADGPSTSLTAAGVAASPFTARSRATPSPRRTRVLRPRRTTAWTRPGALSLLHTVSLKIVTGE